MDYSKLKKGTKIIPNGESEDTSEYRIITAVGKNKYLAITKDRSELCFKIDNLKYWDISEEKIVDEDI